MKWQLYNLILVILLLGCQNEEVKIDESRLGLEFYPVEIGYFRIYNVESVDFIFAQPPDTQHYQLKEVYTEEFENLEGGISYKLERYKRQYPESDWVIDSVWVARKNLYTVTQVENNVPVIKLVFPIDEDKKWDANSSNSKDPDDYQFDDVGQPYTLNDTLEIQNTATVIQEETTDNILFRNIRKEIFAANIGLIYKQLTLLNFCADVDCLGQDIIETGIDYKQELVEYGVE